MLKDIIAVGGSQLLIPAVLFIVVLYAIRGIAGLHGRRSQNRKEFLELWDCDRSQDDLWLEVAIRHLFGTYLPARVIRLAMTQPNRSQALLDLSEIWPFFQFDSTSQKVHWLHKRHDSPQKRAVGRIILIAGYFAFALVASLFGLAAFRYGPASFSGWVYGFCALSVGSLALICLMREDSIKTAARVGEDWLVRINRSREPSPSGSKK